MNYNITVSEDRSGHISVLNVDKIVKVNQYKFNTQAMPKSTFSVSRLASSATMRKATRRSSTTKGKRNRSTK